MELLVGSDVNFRGFIVHSLRYEALGRFREHSRS